MRYFALETIKIAVSNKKIFQLFKIFQGINFEDSFVVIANDEIF